MRPRRTVIAHRHRIVAESLASALIRRAAMTSVLTATTESEVEELTQPMDAVVLDRDFPTVERTLQRLRRSGVRVVLLGEPLDEGHAVPLDASVEALARALLPGPPGRRHMPVQLSPREREILSLVAQGLVAKQVAHRLDISIKTVEHHKHRIYCKLGVPNQAAAIRSALIDGLV